MVGFADLLNPVGVGGFSPRPSSRRTPGYRPVTASNPLSITTQIPIEAVHTTRLLSPPQSANPSSPALTMLLEIDDDEPPRKLQFHLFQDQVPHVCDFFRALCPPDLATEIPLFSTTTAADPRVTFSLPARTACPPASPVSPASPSPVSAALEIPGLPAATEPAQRNEMHLDWDDRGPWMVGLSKTASGGAQVLIHLSTPFDAPSALSPLPLPLPPPSSPSTPATATTELVYFAQVVDPSSQHALLAAYHHAQQQQRRPPHITSFQFATPAAAHTFVDASRLNSQRSESPSMNKMTADSPTSEDLSVSDTSRASATPSSSGRSSSSVGTEKRGRPWGNSWMTVEDLEQAVLLARKRKVVVRRRKTINVPPTSTSHPSVNPPVGERRWGPSWTDGAALAEADEFVVEWVDVNEDTAQQQDQQRPEGAGLQLPPISPSVKQEGQTPIPISPVSLPAAVNPAAFKTAAEDDEIRASKRRKWSIDAEPSSAPIQTSTVQFPIPDSVLSNRSASFSTTGWISPRDVGAAQPRTAAAERVSIRSLLSGGRDGPLPDLAFPRSSTASSCTSSAHSPPRSASSSSSSSTSGSGSTSWGSIVLSNNISPPVRKPSISAPQVPISSPAYAQRSANDGHLSRQSPTKVTGSSRVSCFGSAVYPQSVPNRLGTTRDRPGSSRTATSTSRVSHGQEPVYQQQQYDYPHRNRYEHQFQVSLCPTPHEEMEQMRISTTGDEGGLRIEQYNPYEYGGRRQRRRNTTAGQEAPVASGSALTHGRRPSGSAQQQQQQQQQLAYSSQAPSVQAGLPIPQPLIYLPPSSPEASNSRQTLIRKRKHEALAAPLAAR